MKIRNYIILLAMLLVATSASAMAGCGKEGDKMAENAETVDVPEKFLGGLTPDEALEYMKTTPDLMIVDVRETEWYEGFTQFIGNVHIPYSELSERYVDLPSDRPIILNCGAGVMAPKAYKLLTDLDVNVLSLCYIDGTPLFSQYNSWVESQSSVDLTTNYNNAITSLRYNINGTMAQVGAKGIMIENGKKILVK